MTTANLTEAILVDLIVEAAENDDGDDGGRQKGVDDEGVRVPPQECRIHPLLRHLVSQRPVDHVHLKSVQREASCGGERQT